MRPLVLLSNDDGILSPHLSALADALEAADVCELLVVAPERERSAASHAITLHKPLRLKRVAPNRFSFSGTPVDCVYAGIVKIAERLPALVISGINHGYNLGTDVFYSGTVAAAVEGGLRGVSSMAVSMAPKAEVEAATRFTVALTRAVLADRDSDLTPGTVLNVNVPDGAGERYQWTRLGRRFYQDDVAERHDPRGRPYYWIGGGGTGMAHIPGSDCNAVGEGLISVTPIHLDVTAHHLLGESPTLSPSGYHHITRPPHDGEPWPPTEPPTE